MSREMVGVRVRDEGAWFCPLWVEPQINFGKIESALVLNFDHAGPVYKESFVFVTKKGGEAAVPRFSFFVLR